MFYYIFSTTNQKIGDLFALLYFWTFAQCVHVAFSQLFSSRKRCCKKTYERQKSSFFQIFYSHCTALRMVLQETVEFFQYSGIDYSFLKFSKKDSLLYVMKMPLNRGSKKLQNTLA